MRLIRCALGAALAAALAVPVAAMAAPSSTPRQLPGGSDETVIAVIDSGFSPYHQDFLASQMPPNAGRLPLTEAPDTWLPGFPNPTSFASYAPLKLTLDADPSAKMDTLHAA